MGDMCKKEYCVFCKECPQKGVLKGWHFKHSIICKDPDQNLPKSNFYCPDLDRPNYILPGPNRIKAILSLYQNYLVMDCNKPINGTRNEAITSYNKSRLLYFYFYLLHFITRKSHQNTFENIKIHCTEDTI